MTVTTNNPVPETVSLILTMGESFISAAGFKYVTGETYTLPKEEANKLLAVKGDYDIRFFKKVDGVGGKPKNMNVQEVLPTPAEIADSRNEANAESHAAAVALDKADAIASATRGQGDEVIEAQLDQINRISVVGPTSNGNTGLDGAANGEMDTATEAKPKGRGRPANAVPV